MDAGALRDGRFMTPYAGHTNRRGKKSKLRGPMTIEERGEDSFA